MLDSGQPNAKPCTNRRPLPSSEYMTIMKVAAQTP